MSSKPHPVRSLLPAAAVAAAGLLAAAWLFRGLFMDDSFIGFRYIENLLAGRGFVFNPPVRVEGVTNTGWLLFLAPLAAVLGPPLAAKTAGLLLAAVTFCLSAAAAAPIARRDPRFAALPVLALLATAFHAELTGFALLGMETALLAVLVTAIVALAGRGLLGWLPALGTFAFLVHPEAGLIVPLGAGLAWHAGTLSGRAAARTVAASALGLAAVTLVRWSYFGALLPNTFGSKPAILFTMGENLLGLVLGSAVNLGFPFAGLFALPFVVAGWLVLRRTGLTGSFAGAAFATGLAFSIYAPADWTELARYFAPYAPAAYLLLWTGALRAEREVLAGNRAVRAAGATLAVLAALGGAVAAAVVGWTDTYLWTGLALVWMAVAEAGRALGSRKPLAAAAVLAVLAVHGVLAVLDWTGEEAGSQYPGYVLTSRSLVAPSLWMRDHLPAGGTIATRRIGNLAYWSGHPVFDYAHGLTEPGVSRLIRSRGEGFESPAAPELAAIWRERAPEYILEDRDTLYGIAASQRGSPECFLVHGLAYRVVRGFPIGRGMEWLLAAREAACPPRSSQDTKDVVIPSQETNPRR